MEARVLGDVHHPRDAQQRSIGVDHRRRIEGRGVLALEHVQHHDDSVLPRFLAERPDQRTIQRLGKGPNIAGRWMLWMKPLERQLRKAGEPGAVACGCLEVRETARNVELFVPGRALLNEGDFHPTSGRRAG